MTDLGSDHQPELPRAGGRQPADADRREVEPRTQPAKPGAFRPPDRLRISSIGSTAWIAIGAIVVVSAVVLRTQGRTWWCGCGHWSPWWGDVWSAHGCQHLIDPYSFTHVLHGVVLFWLLAVVASRVPLTWRLVGTVLLEAIWELFENSAYVLSHHRAATAALGYTGDSIGNSLGDISSCAIGFVLARRLGLRGSLLLFAVTEVVLLIWIRDSLLLIVFTSIFPSDAIKAWQLGLGR